MLFGSKGTCQGFRDRFSSYERMPQASLVLYIEDFVNTMYLGSIRLGLIRSNRGKGDCESPRAFRTFSNIVDHFKVL